MKLKIYDEPTEAETEIYQVLLSVERSRRTWKLLAQLLAAVLLFAICGHVVILFALLLK